MNYSSVCKIISWCIKNIKTNNKITIKWNKKFTLIVKVDETNSKTIYN